MFYTEPQCRDKTTSTLWVLTPYGHSHHTALLPSLIARCALVEPRRGHGEILQQDSSRVAVVYTSRKMTVIPSDKSVFIVYFIVSLT